MVDSSASYNLFLGRDWIHANWCVPFSLHQFLLLLNYDEVEVVWADNKPFSTCSDNLKARFYDVNLGPIKFTRGRPKSESKLVPIPKEDMEEVLQ